MPMRKLLLGGVVAVAALIPAGCGGNGGTDSGATGTVHGTITMSGGPPGAQSAGGSGTVTAKKGSTEVATQTVAEGQQFSFTLPTGKYRLSVSNAGLPCIDATVTITTNTDRSVPLVCSRK
jgi:hypothetical protein